MVRNKASSFLIPEELGGFDAPCAVDFMISYFSHRCLHGV